MRSKSTVITLFMCMLFFAGAAFAQDAAALKSDIYSKLKCCACAVSFDRCSCPEAKEMKAYIDALIENGVEKEEIFYKTARKFSLNVILDQRLRQDIEKRLIREAGDKRPQIVLDPVSFDFGPLSKKTGKASRIFKLSNKGSAPLAITRIKTSCPCAAASLNVDKNKSPFFSTEGSPADWKMEIAAGQTAGLELAVDLSSQHVKTGKLIRDVFITSNDPVYPEVSARIETEVTE